MSSQQKYTITQVSEMYNIKPNTLRYYERIGLLPKIPRQPNGNRYFTDDLNKWLEMVICLRHSGVSIEVLIDYCQLLMQGNQTVEVREAILRDQLAILENKQKNLQRSIDRLNHKIGLYESGEILNESTYYEEYGIIFDEEGSWKVRVDDYEN
ncbi:MerR family transcriptional regulator [Staphylococcus microti]|uniref:MerR family transcriptional regulator n=1 Tax=Staphylococcus microti TaxID=569857 RepID=A0A0D6XPU3_9STAP|nr:MerR family transcriptional regulator [Staphylococcus microti]KIX90266.1 MerR family transcriptional regulator [Staphylococcus microti]PNZ82516.1 MerR family transcriptional regulator [Staphylococcus microti]SUM57289.1 transcriptional regulator, MerR family [Staphylococcus microti]